MHKYFTVSPFLSSALFYLRRLFLAYWCYMLLDYLICKFCPRLLTKALQNKWRIIFRFPKEKTTLWSKRTLQFYNQLTPGCVDLTFSFQRVFVSANTSWLKKCLKKRKFIPWQMCCWGLAHSEKHRGDNSTGFWALTRPLCDSCGTDGSCAGHTCLFLLPCCFCVGGLFPKLCF